MLSLLSCPILTYAQTQIAQTLVEFAPTATGGEATGSGGTASFSVGQIVYTTNIGANGTVAQGVQQPYEISTTLGINETTINLELSVFPNPTTNFLTLKVKDNTQLSYLLYNLQGQLLESKSLQSTSTNINLEAQPTATYFVKIFKNNQPIKTFKIIKN